GRRRSPKNLRPIRCASAAASSRSIQSRWRRARRPRSPGPEASSANPQRKQRRTTVKLYGFPPSPNTWKVRAVAAHIGLPLELELVDLAKGQQHTPAFRALNPTGRTPVLVDGDFILWESNAIIQYLADRKPTPLWPNDARIRADIVRWQCWQLMHWSKEACQPLIFERMVK